MILVNLDNCSYVNDVFVFADFRRNIICRLTQVANLVFITRHVWQLIVNTERAYISMLFTVVLWEVNF